MREISTVKFYIKIGLFVVGWVALSASALFAQSGNKPSTPFPSTPAPSDMVNLGNVRGRVVLPDGRFISESVKVTLQDKRGNRTTIFSDSEGRFEFHGLVPEKYQIEVEGDGQRFETVNINVDVYRGVTSALTVPLKAKSTSDQPRTAEKSVSVGELENDANVPAKARKEFEQASRAAEKGKTDEAISHLKKAIEIYPDFAMAHNDLGVQFLNSGKLDEAADAFNRAIAINPNAFNPRLNLGIVLVEQHQFAQAVAPLEKAISLRSDAPAARLYMGIARMGLGDAASAEKELQRAYQLGGHQYALALFHLGELYMNNGERAKALASFEAFLKEEPNAPNAPQVRKLISMLR